MQYAPMKIRNHIKIAKKKTRMKSSSVSIGCAKEVAQRLSRLILKRIKMSIIPCLWGAAPASKAAWPKNAEKIQIEPSKNLWYTCLNHSLSWKEKTEIMTKHFIAEIKLSNRRCHAKQRCIQLMNSLLKTRQTWQATWFLLGLLVALGGFQSCLSY